MSDTQQICMASRLDADGYFAGETYVQEDPENKGKFLVPDDTFLIAPPVPIEEGFRYKLIKKGRRHEWKKEKLPQPKPVSTEYQAGAMGTDSKNEDNIPHVAYNGKSFLATPESWLTLKHLIDLCRDEKAIMVATLDGALEPFLENDLIEITDLMQKYLFEDKETGIIVVR